MEELPQENIGDKQPKNVWKILTIILAIILVISYFKPFSGEISEDDLKSKVEEYVNGLLQAQGAAVTASVISIEDENNLYKLNIDIGGEINEVHVTKDGSKLIPQMFDLITGSTIQEIPKTKTPEIKLFVMSQCPYGTMAEEAIKPVLDLFKDKIDFNLFFIANENADGTFLSLHGQPEVDEDIRQLCAIKYYPDTYMDYIECINKDYVNLPWKTCSENMPKIKECSESDEGKKLLSENIKEAYTLGVGASPTIIINDVDYQGARTSEALKQAICSAFNKEQAECEEELSTTSDAPAGSC